MDDMSCKPFIGYISWDVSTGWPRKIVYCLFIIDYCLSNAKTTYRRLDTAKNLDNSLWSLSSSQSPKLQNVSESERNRSQKFHAPYTSATNPQDLNAN